MRHRPTYVFALLLASVVTTSAHAATKVKSTTLDCNFSPLQQELDKLDRTIANVIEFTGDCAEPVIIDGHRDLTLLGVGGASISGQYVAGDSTASVNAVTVTNSSVSIQDVTINAGDYGVLCTDRSTCVIRDTTIQSGHSGVAAQNQSEIDILGASQIIDAEGFGVAAYGASSINMRPNWDSGVDIFEAGPVVSGNNVGIWVQDGSFFRSDNVTVTNNQNGVQAQRDAVIKMFVSYDFDNGQWAVPGAGITNNSGYGVLVHRNSSAQIGLPILNNGGPGIRLGSLSYLQNAGLYFDQNGGGDVDCRDATAVSDFCPSLAQTLNDMQAQIDALTAAANATLEEKVSGKTFAVKSTGHGVGGFNIGAESLPITLFGVQRDFSVSEGLMQLNDDGTWNIQLSLVILAAPLSFLDAGENGTFINGQLNRYSLEINNNGTWSVDPATNEILLANANELMRLQASPNGEVLTTMSNDQRLTEGDPTAPGFFNSYIADSVYVQVPD